MSQRFGLTQETIDALKSLFAPNPKIKKVLIYGSRVKGNYRVGSDIDICLVGPDLQTNDLLGLENQIDDLMLPYKIDLSILHQIENQNLVDHITRVGVALD